jgi:hypothetical protein
MRQGAARADERPGGRTLTHRRSLDREVDLGNAVLGDLEAS